MKFCGYCRYFAKAKILKSTRDELIKECKTKEKRVIEFISENCEYYHPNIHFFCRAYTCRLALVDCLNRRFNDQNLDAFSDCKDCQQFKEEIQDTINEYMIQANPILKPPRPNKLKIRRKKKIDSKLPIRRKKTDN